MDAAWPTDLLPILALDGLLWLWVWLAPTLVLRCRFLPRGILGVAFPGLILVRAETFDQRVLRHELAHVRQMRRWSPMGAWLVQAWSYVLRPWVILLTQRRWPSLRELYYGNPFEREAFAAMDRDDALPRTWGARPGQAHPNGTAPSGR